MQIKQLEEIKNLIDSSKSIALFTHTSPDGDAIGSILAMSNYLKNIGKETFALIPTSCPKNLQFLDTKLELKIFHENDSAKLAEVDLYIILDLNDYKRIGLAAETMAVNKKKTILIDHHQEPKISADAQFIDTDATSTCEMLFQLMEFLGTKPVNEEIANCLYTGIITDTGNFKYDRTSAETFRIVSELLRFGVKIVSLVDQIFSQNSLNALHLLGLALSKIETHCDGKLAIISLDLEDFQSTKTSNEHTEAIVSYTLSLQDVKVGALISINLEDQTQLKLSLRSKVGFPIREIAAKLGGGGHQLASGARVTNMPKEELIRFLVEEVGKM